MAKLSPITGKEMVRFLEGEGFEVVRIRGSFNLVVERDTIPPPRSTPQAAS